jgi:hypothetical protein
MSEITINIIDNSRVISGYAHASHADELVASLAAEPETIAELEEAFRRFRGHSDLDLFGFFYEGFDPEPYDAGILIIDLAARTVACRSTYSAPAREGTVPIKTTDGDRFPMPYLLSHDWEFVRDTANYEYVAADRRERREQRVPTDHRSVLYGEPLFEYVAESRTAHADDDDEDLIVNLHARWLTAERDDLGGVSPRDAMLERHDAIVTDLHSRALQWSFTKDCPAPIPEDSAAYRFAGFGTNEIVVYHDLVRDLLEFAFTCDACAADAVRSEASRWLATANPELSDRIPSEIIDAERRRINLTVSSAECLIAEDCEICRMLAADFDNPMFWGLDGSSMESDRFEFSFFATREEFDENRRRFDEFSVEFDKRYENAALTEGEIF